MGKCEEILREIVRLNEASDFGGLCDSDCGEYEAAPWQSEALRAALTQARQITEGE